MICKRIDNNITFKHAKAHSFEHYKMVSSIAVKY